MVVGNVYVKYYMHINQGRDGNFTRKYRGSIGGSTSDCDYSFSGWKHLKYPDKDESVGYTVKSKEKDFTISNYPLEQTEFLYDSKQGMVILNFILIQVPSYA